MKKKTVAVLVGLIVTLIYVPWSSASTTIFEKNVTIKNLKRVVFNGTFSANPQSHYRLTLINGGAATAKVTLNRIIVIDEKSLGARVDRDITLKNSNTIGLVITGNNGSTLHLLIECLDCAEISILSPTDGASIYTPTVVVKGTFIPPTQDIGVTVNGLPAGVSGERWAAEVPLTEGANTLTAKVSSGVEKSISVNCVPREFSHVEADPKSGVSPLQVTFRMISAPQNNCSVDYEGDGVFDYQGVFQDLTYTYSADGIYTPVFICGGYRAETLINVFNKDKLDALLRARWEALKSSLASGDIEGAEMNLTSDSRQFYKEEFGAFQKGGILPQVVAELQSSVFTLVSVRNDRADYAILVVRDGKTLSYPLIFKQDTDGTWRIWMY